MPKKITDADELKVIDAIQDQVATLTKAHWGEICRARADNEGMIALSYQANLDYNGEERTIKTTISFSVGRVRDSRQEVINPNQPDLPGAGE
jgi:hypothetical protein